MSFRVVVAILMVLLVAGCADPDDPPPAPLVIACDGCGSWTMAFFDKDRATLTDSTRRMMDSLLPLWMEGRASLKLIGHADVTGTARRNMELSRARAETLRAYLERNGMAAGSVVVEARGNTQRLVEAPTPNEPQNQRVEVTLLDYAARPPCFKEHDRQLMEWHRRNCVPEPRFGRREDCANVQRQLPR